MLQVGFEPTIPVLERAKSVYSLDRAATVIRNPDKYYCEIRDRLLTNIYLLIVHNLFRLYKLSVDVIALLSN
jgi:hypothetical protein